MANFHQHVLQICILSLCVFLSTVYGKALKKPSTGVYLDGNKPKILFDPNKEKIGDRPTDYDDEDYGDPADERQYYYDNYQQPLGAQIDRKQSQLTQSMVSTKTTLLDSNNMEWKDSDSEPANSLSENNDNETKFDVTKMMRKEYKDTMQKTSDSVGQTGIKESDGSINKSVPSGSVTTTAWSEKLNASGLLKIVSDVIKRGAIRNATGNQTEKFFVDGSGKTEVPFKKDMSHLVEMSTTKKDNYLGFGALDNVPNKILPKSTIPKNEMRIEPSESGSAATQPLGLVLSGNDSRHNNKNGPDTELDSIKPSESVNSTTNNDTSTSVKYGGNNSEVNTKVNSTSNSSSQIKPDGHSTLILRSETTNPSKGGDGTQQLEQGINNNTSSLALQKEGTVSQQGTSKAPLSATATSSKVPAKFQTSKLPSSQSLGDSSYDSSSTTTSTTTRVSTTYQKNGSVKSDDSDLSIDQPLESNRGGGLNIQQPYQGEFVEEGLPMVHSTPVNDQDSHFFAYFASLLITAALGYVVYHNRNKILALLLEGRRARGSSGSRRGSSADSIGRRRGRGGGGGAKYLPLHTSLDQVMTSNGTENGGDSGLDRVY